ncbi:MAG: hypothetical protein HUK03_00575 [Bacteroidaceae bacterium]|nr:hypothetical protein [Bacteroidaceae bacterium]
MNVRDLTPIDITGIATTTPAPVPEAKAYKNGEIVIKSEAGKELTLQGMRSEVTGMARVEEFLFATSLDGTLRIWNLRSELLMPVTIYSHSKWIYCMHHDKADKTLYLGTADGMLLRVTISPRRLAERITDRLSQDEWNEFVGTDIEYRYSKK